MLRSLSFEVWRTATRGVSHETCLRYETTVPANWRRKSDQLSFRAERATESPRVVEESLFDLSREPSPRRNYPKISLTFSNIDELRAAGLFSTFNVAPSCSINLRCSRVNFVGVMTRT